MSSTTTTKIYKFFKNYNYEWRYKLVVCLPIFIVLVGLDWITKGVVQATMSQGPAGAVKFIPGFMDFQYILNPGSAYGVNANNLALAVSLATVMTILLTISFIFINSKHWLVGLTIVLAGSFANLLARAWAQPVGNYDGVDPKLIGVKGGVVDFLHFQFNFAGSDGYVFNLADVWVIAGVIGILVGVIVELIISGIRASKTQKTVASEEVNVATTRKTKTKQPVEFVEKDESQMSPTQKKQYQKELKAYQKMKKMEVKKDEKNANKPRK